MTTSEWLVGNIGACKGKAVDYFRVVIDWLNMHRSKLVAVGAFSIVVLVYRLWDWFDVEKVKAIAYVVQAFGFVVAAFLTYRYTMKLESHKYEMKLKEIVHANTHKREQESLEKINRLMAKMVFKLGLVPPFFNDPEPVPARTEEESHEQWNQRRFSIKAKAFNDAMLRLNHAEEEASIYLNPGMQERTEKFRQQAVKVLEVYFARREASKVTMGDPSSHLKQFKDDLQGLREERQRIVEDFRKQLMRLKE